MGQAAARSARTDPRPVLPRPRARTAAAGQRCPLGVFGASQLALGGMLLAAAREPIRNRAFAHLVIWHESTVGVLSDAWFISRDYIPDAAHHAFIVVHLAVIATGVRALRATPRPVSSTHGTTHATAGAR